MIARLRLRLNALEQRAPRRYAIGLVLACDAVVGVALLIARPFA